MAPIDFTRAGFPQMYENSIVGPLFKPWVATLFEKVALKDGDSVLDVACGTGIVSRMAKEKLGSNSRVVGVDLNPGMLALAKTISPTVEFREGNAMALPLADNEVFDVVFCHQGIQFFPDSVKALVEMRRALVPGGRMAIGAWSLACEVPFYQELQNIVERHVGAVDDQRYCFGDAAKLKALLVGAGFRDARAQTMSKTAHFADRHFLKTNAAALVGMSSAAQSLDDADRDALIATIVTESAAVADQHADGGGLKFGVRNIIGWAER